MNTLVLLSAIFSSAAPLEDGTLLFLENANSVVRVATGGKVGHVAIALSDNGAAWIYEATPAKVRRVSPADYFQELARINKKRDDDDKVRILALRPQRPYTAAELAAMRAFLNDQLGRRYSLLNYVKDEEGDGIHCAELAGSALNATGRYSFEQPHSIHPSAFLKHVKPTHRPAETLTFSASVAKQTWCQRADRRWGEIWRWTRWSCGEVWAFCF